MSDDLDIPNKSGKRRKRPLSSASSSESSDNGNPLVAAKRSRKQLIDSSDESSSSENEGSDTIRPSLRRGASKILSDYETGSSIDEDEGVLTDSSESYSDNEEGSEEKLSSEKTKLDGMACGSSSDSDGQSEKCPICLVKFNHQEIGTPETCDHYFCAPCIQEWAKNVNTCPVDRQPFTLILVRQHLEGKVIRQVPVNVPIENQEPPEDATFCEVCGQSGREDRMLLCDSCDHGYHMECLNPPLDHVPIDEWFCPECAPLYSTMHRRRGRARGQHREEEVDDVEENLPLHRIARRLLPRTRQSERVRTNLRNTRQRSWPLQASTSSGVESMEGERIQVQQPRPKRTRRTGKKTGRRRRYQSFRIKRIVTDDGVVEVRVKSKKKRKFKKKKNKSCFKSTSHTVKGRLANKLGMCAPRMKKQIIPETINRQELTSAPINHQRHQAGVPTLDLFGRRDQLDYFSGSESENDAESLGRGVGVLSRARVAHSSDRLISRLKAASVLNSISSRRPLKIEKAAPTASVNLLDSILDSQTLWHSKKAEIKSSSDGSIRVILPKNSNGEVLKDDPKIDVRNTAAPVIGIPMFPGGRVTSGTYKHDNSGRGNDRGSDNQRGNRTSSEQSYEEGSSYQSSSGPGESGITRYDNSVGTSSLRGIAPIRFRMNVPPKRPNIHSYPSDNIPPPPPLRLRSPLVEMTFPSTNSPEASPPKDEDEIDIYSDIEPEADANETEEKTFGTLEPPPEPPFLMTMEPPPEPPAILMNLNDEASDDEPSGLVIDDPPQGDVYDPCAVNSDDSSAEDAPLSKPPEVPAGLKDPDLVADYSSDSCPTTGTSSYNPELPTYFSTPIIGPIPRPASHNSSEAEDNDEECPNFSMYSAESMNLAQRGLPAPIINLDIPIPPPVKEDTLQGIDIPLPDIESHSSSDKEESLSSHVFQDTKNDSLPHDNDKISNEVKSNFEESIDSDKEVEEDNACVNSDTVITGEQEEKHVSYNAAEIEESNENEEGKNEGFDIDDADEDDESEGNCSVPGDTERATKPKTIKTKGTSEAGEDECSTQGDVLDLAFESEPNLENNITHDNEEQNEIHLSKSPVELEENNEKIVEGGDKSDGLVDITDEEMSEYDGQDNDDIEKLDDQVFESTRTSKNGHKSDERLDSDDDNSLVGGATSAVSAGTLNNSDNVQPPTLPGLEGLETEIISESEDVNFDELPLEGNDQAEVLRNDEDHGSSRKKKKKKNHKVSHNEDGSNKGNNEPLEFEEGEIIEDKPKQLPKKDKKIKPKQDSGVEVDENVDTNKSKVEKEQPVEKKTKKKKDKSSTARDKNDKTKEPKEKILKAGQVDENVSWKKLSKSTKERNYRDGKEKDERDKERENKEDGGLSKKDRRNKEKRKELERYDVRRLISEKPKRPKKDEFGRDISPSKSGSSLSPYRPPRYRSPLRTRNRSRTRSRSWKSRSRSRGRRRRSRSRDRIRSRDRSRKTRSRDRSRRRSRSRNKLGSRSRERRKTPDKAKTNRSLSRGRRRSQSPPHHSRRRRSLSYRKSWTPSFSKSSMSRSQSPQHKKRTRSVSRSKSRSWTREQNATTIRDTRVKDPPKNLTVIVTNKDALKKKEKKKPTKKKDDRRKKKRGQSPAPSKEVFTSGDNILVSVNFKNANKNPEIIPASTPLLRESSKRKRDDADGSAKKKKTNSSSKKTPTIKKSNRLAKINEVTRNAKPVAIIDLDLSPFREQTLSPKEVIVLSDSGEEGDKQRSDMQDGLDRIGHNVMTQSMLSLSSNDHGQKNSMSQPESPLSSSFLLNSSGPKTPPEPHIKFSITTKPSQIRMLSNPLMEAEEEMEDENTENDMNEILHKGPNTPPEPPPELNTPASPPTTPYDPFDPTKSRSPSPQPRSSDAGSQLNTSREDKLDSLQNDEDDHHAHIADLKTSTPPNESEDAEKTPEASKVHSTPKADPNNTDVSPKVSPPIGTSESNKLPEDTLMKPIQKLLSGANKLDITVHKSPEKLITVVINQQVKGLIQTPKQAIQPLKMATPNKHQTPKGNMKHQLFSSSLVKQVPILGTLPLLPGPPVYTPSMSLNSSSKTIGRIQQNGDPSDDMDIDPSSPYSPGSSEGDDLFEPPIATPPRNSSKPITNKSKSSSGNKFDSLFGSSPAKPRHGRHSSKATKKGTKSKSKGSKKEEVKVKLDEDQLKILDELPSSAVEMQVKDKFLKKLNRQERVVEEVKLVLKPHYAKKHINKEEYKEILRRSVPKICHNKSGEINPIKIQFLVEAYVKKFRYAKKKASGALLAPAQNKPKAQKTLWS